MHVSALTRHGRPASAADPTVVRWHFMATALACAATFTALGRIAPHSLWLHMLLHAIAMGIVAPLLAAPLRSRTRLAGFVPVALATIVQLAAFFAWHSPQWMHWAMGSVLASGLMHASLLACAIVFWGCVFANDRRAPWLAVLALVTTGKTVCLLAALWVFSVRDLAGHGGIAAQQLGGLVMLSLCPLLYLLPATRIVIRHVLPCAVEDRAASHIGHGH